MLEISGARFLYMFDRGGNLNAFVERRDTFMAFAGGEPNDERLKSFTTLIWQAPVLEIMVPFQQQIDTSTKLRILREIPWQVSDCAQKMNRVNFDHLLRTKHKDMQNAKHEVSMSVNRCRRNFSKRCAMATLEVASHSHCHSLKLKGKLQSRSRKTTETSVVVFPLSFFWWFLDLWSNGFRKVLQWFL